MIEFWLDNFRKKKKKHRRKHLVCRYNVITKLRCSRYRTTKLRPTWVIYTCGWQTLFFARMKWACGFVPNFVNSVRYWVEHDNAGQNEQKSRSVARSTGRPDPRPRRKKIESKSNYRRWFPGLAYTSWFGVVNRNSDATTADVWKISIKNRLSVEQWSILNFKLQDLNINTIGRIERWTRCWLRHYSMSVF